MCKFFSVVSDGKGKVMYFDWELRKQCLSGKLNYEPDSHTSIADYFGYKGEKEDKLNKYEYNPLTKEFEIDQLNTKDDSKNVLKFIKKLNFKEIVPQLIVKEILNPLEIERVGQITKQEKLLLKKWASVWASVGDSVWASVWDSVRDSVWDSVRASVSQYFKIDNWKYLRHKKGENPYQCLIDLWDKGLVPSFDGDTWRLHTGKKAKIVLEITQKELKEGE